MTTPAEAEIGPTRHQAPTFQVVPPGQFDFHRPNDWPKWIRRFERFHHASGLKEKDEETQVHTLIYTMGHEANDILSSFALVEADRKKYVTVCDKFNQYFVKRKNIIFERVRFNQRQQAEGE